VRHCLQGDIWDVHKVDDELFGEASVGGGGFILSPESTRKSGLRVEVEVGAGVEPDKQIRKTSLNPVSVLRVTLNALV
jgi:phosphotransferase system IIA component